MNIPSWTSTRRNFWKGLLGLFTALRWWVDLESALSPPTNIELFDFLYSSDTTWSWIAREIGNQDSWEIISGLLRSYYTDIGFDTPDSNLRNISRLKTLRDMSTPKAVNKVLTSSAFGDCLREDETLDALRFIDDDGNLTITEEEISRYLDNQGTEIIDDLKMKESDWEKKSSRKVIDSIMTKIVWLTVVRDGYSITWINPDILPDYIRHYEEYLVWAQIPPWLYQVWNSYRNHYNWIGISGWTIVEALLKNIE